MGNQKLKYEVIKQSFEAEGYTLLSIEYKNNHIPLKYICPKNHKHKISWNSWQYGRRCGLCFGTHKPSYENVKQSFEAEGYILLSTEYVNAHQYLKYVCPNGHEHKIKWWHWQNGRRCGICHYITYEQVKQSFEDEGYTLVSTEYKNVHDLLQFICPSGHKHEISFHNWQYGKRCGLCKPKDSVNEREIRQHVIEIYHGVVLTNDRTMIQNPKTGEFLELDIWLPEVKKAIEYNGKYWHSDKYSKYKDSVKQQYCNDNGIDLLVINEEHWIKNKDFTIISSFLSK